MAKPMEAVSRTIAWLLAMLVMAAGIGLVWAAIVVPFRSGVVPLVSESVFAMGTLSTGFAFVMLSMQPSPAAAWLVGLIGMLTICLNAAMLIFARASSGLVVKAEDYLRMIAGVVLLGAVTWLWIKATHSPAALSSGHAAARRARERAR